MDKDVVLCWDFVSAYNCIATFAIARSQVTDILSLLHFAATFYDR